MENIESILDEDNQILQEFDTQRQFIEAILEYDLEALLIITSRRPLTLSLDSEIASMSRNVRIQLDWGLPESFAIALLRELDPVQ